MGTAILYCDSCGRIVPPSEAASGKVVISRSVTVCAACLESLSEEERDTLKASVGPAPEPPPPSRRTPTGMSHHRVDAYSGAHAAPDGSKKTALVAAGAIAGLLAGVAVAVVMAGGGESAPPPPIRHAPPPVVVPAREADPRPPTPLPPAREEPLAHIRRMIDPTLGRYDEIVRALDAARDGNDEKAKSAEAALRREVNALYNGVAASAFASARATAKGLCDDGDLVGALAQVSSVGTRYVASGWFASKGEQLIADARGELEAAYRSRIEQQLALAAEAVEDDRFADVRERLSRSGPWPEDLRAKAAEILASAKKREDAIERLEQGGERWNGFLKDFIEAGKAGVAQAEDVLKREAVELRGFGLGERVARYREWVREAKLVQSLALDALGEEGRRVRIHVDGRPISGTVASVDGAELVFKPVVGDAVTVEVARISPADLARYAGVTSGENANPVRAGAYMLVRGDLTRAAKLVEDVVDERGEALSHDVAEVAELLAPPKAEPLPLRPEEIAAQQAAREPALDVTKGLVAHWKFDETDGDTASDASGNGHHARLREGARFAPGEGKVGGAASFQGGNQFLEAPATESLNRSSQSSCTVAVWVRPDSKPKRAKPDENYGILMKSGYHSGLLYEHSGFMRFCVWNEGGGQFDAGSPGPYEPGSYHHLAGVLNLEKSTVQLYVDGKLSQTRQLPGGFRVRNYGTAPWYVGVGSPWHEFYRYSFDGKIDDARIYERALSDEEIEAVYELGARSSLARGLVAHWKLDEAEGTTAADSSGRGLDAEVVGAGEAPAWRPGRVGPGCLAFDGKDDHVVLSNEKSNKIPLQTMSVAFWARPERLGAMSTLVAKRWNGCIPTFVFHTTRENGILHYWGYAADPWRDSNIASEPGILERATWIHVAVTRDGGKGDFRLYIDGVEHATRLGSRPGARFAEDVPWQPVTIGARYLQPTEAYGNFFDGCIDDVRIYDRVLAPDEVKVLAEK